MFGKKTLESYIKTAKITVDNSN